MVRLDNVTLRIMDRPGDPNRTPEGLRFSERHQWSRARGVTLDERRTAIEHELAQDVMALLSRISRIRKADS